ncbi:hypothetical protein OJ253_967 [Cryptosporidium canis]|uniref:Signal peptide-containing protein n=1 Tax=Cryptosporidium canis TaxID=195482 RepID=A0A9D5DIH8_9CRYT|nr:hypothetical protein OJ253_967 [Cryptosporidium canis]
MKLVKIALELVLCLVLIAWKPKEVDAARFWKPIFGSKYKVQGEVEENASGTLILDYCSVLTPNQIKLSNLFIIVSKRFSFSGISLLDACYVVYVLRDGYFSGCDTALDLTIKEERIRANRAEICSEVLMTAKDDPDIKDLVREAHPDDVHNVIEKVESVIKMGTDNSGGESCAMLSNEELSIANALVVLLIDEGYRISRARACTVVLSLKEGSLEDCAKSLRSALRGHIEYVKAEQFCRQIAEFATKKTPLLSDVPKKGQIFPLDRVNPNLKQKVEVNEAILVALAIDNRCHLDELDIRQILFTDYPSTSIVVDRRQLFDRFLIFYNRNKLGKMGKRWFKDGVLNGVEEEESNTPLGPKMELVNLTNQQALQTLYSTYRSLIGSFKETQKFVQDIIYQRGNVPESLKRRFYLQIQFVKYMEKHIGALKEYIETDNVDILSASNLPYGVSDLKSFSELAKKDWKHSIVEDKPYDEMSHFSLFCPLLHRSAFRLALLVVGIAQSVLGKTKIKLPDVCLAIAQVKNGHSYKSSIKLALSAVFVNNQKILDLDELEILFNLLVTAVDETVSEFLLGIPEEFFDFEGESEITDEKLERWIAKVEHRLAKVIIEPKSILNNMSLFDVDMIMQNISPLEAKLQLLIGVSVRRIHEALADLTDIEHEMRRISNRIEFARIQTDSSNEIAHTQEYNLLEKKREVQLQKVIDLGVEHSGYCAKAIDVFDISDRPIVRKVHRVIAVSTELRRLRTSYSKAMQGEPIFKSNKVLLRTSIINHRISLAKRVLEELIIGEPYNPSDSRWYTSFDECFNNSIPDLKLPLKLDPSHPIEGSSGFTKITPKNKPPKYNLLCDKNQLRRFKKFQPDLEEILQFADIPIIDFEGKKPLLADILTLEGWAPLKTTIRERDEANIPCSIAKQLFRRVVSDISQRATGGTSFFNIPLVHLWCADHIRFRRGNQAIWRNLIPRIWAVFIDNPLDINGLRSNKWAIDTWFR